MPAPAAADTETASPDDGRQQRVVIVGAGQTGRHLARELARERRVVVVDTDAEKLERLRKEAEEAPLLETLQRDGTSALTLRDAGAADAEWVIAATDRDSVNIEVCRVASGMEPKPGVLGTLRAASRIERLRATGADSVVGPTVIASQILNRIESSHQVATSLGLGKGEIREIQVLPTSPAVGARLRDLGARKWIVAGIYRADRFLVPHGEAVIQAGDRLLITGEPEIAPGAAEFLREGKSLFPLQFGSHIVLLSDEHLPDIAWREAEYLFRSSRARRFRIVAPPGVSPPAEFGVHESTITRIQPGDDPAALARQDAGCVVIRRGEPSLTARLGLSTARFFSLMARFPCPVLLPEGSFPWERVVIPITDHASSLPAAETAIGLASQFEIPLAALSILPPGTIGGETERENIRATESAIERLAGLYRVRAPMIHAEGNPPRELPRLTRPGDLVVIGYHPRRTGSFFRPEPAVHMMLRTKASVLAIPLAERALPELRPRSPADTTGP